MGNSCIIKVVRVPKQTDYFDIYEGNQWLGSRRLSEEEKEKYKEQIRDQDRKTTQVLEGSL